MDIYNVIKEPLVTEKATKSAAEKGGRYYFRVDQAATKIDIRRAVENIFRVRVNGVRTISVHGKSKLNARSRRATKAHDWKKAIVTLKKGDKIQLFEGV